MKIFKNILTILIFIINIPLGILMTAGISWYIFPQMKQIIPLLNYLDSKSILWITIGASLLYLIFTIVTKIFNKEFNAKTKNFFIHFNSWLICLITAILSIIIFIMDNSETTFEFESWKKIGLGIDFIILFFTYMFSAKISKAINRRIQAYETSKELNIVGRGNIIYINILKFIETFFPQTLVLFLICFCLNINYAKYFIIIVAAFIIPVIGNIECDLNTRAEIKRKQDLEKLDLINKVSENIRTEGK